MLTDDSFLRVRRPDLSEIKALKLHLPLNYVLRLHQLRILDNRSVSEIVQDALVTYFEEQRAKRQTVLAAVP